ncbi:hypothetical protein MIC97_20135 [Aquamicrobium sp. NLF2-7]|uniref:hypothetical protein n=1 Tax=Aquamicrobium sp. NLF2-7 TaxID=2918753 RepID=UPI001EFBF882|nr:hypothetical protein [Aquamicrobium sp. NLF2-7]MCG8273505.1 hypothetical protein [Aquamicrobium sp. NLF2-7]MCG8273798.1 hypothetical protein [Aquamicrobium sp. NLF2-7]
MQPDIPKQWLLGSGMQDEPALFSALLLQQAAIWLEECLPRKEKPSVLLLRAEIYSGLSVKDFHPIDSQTLRVCAYGKQQRPVVRSVRCLRRQAEGAGHPQ